MTKGIGRNPLRTAFVAVFVCVGAVLVAACSPPMIETAQFSVTGQLNLSWTMNKGCVVTGSAAIIGQGTEDVTVSLMNGSFVDFAIQIPRNGGSFSLPNSSALAVVQLLGYDHEWIAESYSPISGKMGSGTVTAAANGRSGSIDVTLKPVQEDIPRVRNATRDVHVSGSWSGCPAPIPVS